METFPAFLGPVLLTFCDTSQEFQPMASQLSKKAALPLAKILATCRNNVSNTGPWPFWGESNPDKGDFGAKGGKVDVVDWCLFEVFKHPLAKVNWRYSISNPLLFTAKHSTWQKPVYDRVLLETDLVNWDAQLCNHALFSRQDNFHSFSWTETDESCDLSFWLL